MATYLPRTFRGLDDLFRDVERAFWSGVPAERTNGGGQRTFGALDVVEEPERYLVSVDLPGVKKNEIELTLDRQVLQISVNSEQATEQERKGVMYSERVQTALSRGVPLPKAATDEIDANLQDGVLTIEIRKAPEKTTKKIAIR